MQIKKIKKQPEEIQTIFVEAVLMPQGEIISLGKTIGWFKDYKQHIFEVDPKEADK